MYSQWWRSEKDDEISATIERIRPTEAKTERGPAPLWADGVLLGQHVAVVVEGWLRLKRSARFC
jgi:hypothetical protein